MRQERKNGSLTETAINTLKIENIAVPNSTGATLVMLDYAELDLVPATPVAATVVQRDAVLIAGKVTPTTAKLSEAGAVAARHISVFGAAGGAEASAIYTAGEEPMCSPIILTKNPQDGLFYVTLAIKGTSEGAGDTGSVHYHFRFRVQ